MNTVVIFVGQSLNEDMVNRELLNSIVARLFSEFDLDQLENIIDTITNKNQEIKRIFPTWPRNQHQRNNLFEETGSIYINRISKLIKTKSMITGNIKLIKTESEENIDLNTQSDFDYCEYLQHTDN